MDKKIFIYFLLGVILTISIALFINSTIVSDQSNIRYQIGTGDVSAVWILDTYTGKAQLVNSKNKIMAEVNYQE